MQSRINLSDKLNLTKQIDVLKSFYEHRRRLDFTKQRSPQLLKKSMTFDQQKTALFSQWKYRKIRTNEYNSKKQYEYNQTKDGIMMRKIYEYDKKKFAFSLNVPRPRTTLHHNAQVFSNQKSRIIDNENQKLMFRIGRANSQYSKEAISSRPSPVVTSTTFLKRSQTSKWQMRKRSEMGKRFDTDGQQIEKTQRKNLASQSAFEVVKSISRLSVTKNQNPEIMRLHTSKSQKECPMLKSSSLKNITKSTLSTKECERTRRERIAAKLLQKKLKMQYTIPSKFLRQR